MTKPDLFIVAPTDEMVAEANGLIDMMKERGMNNSAIIKASSHPSIEKGIAQTMIYIIKGVV